MIISPYVRDATALGLRQEPLRKGADTRMAMFTMPPYVKEAVGELRVWIDEVDVESWILFDEIDELSPGDTALGPKLPGHQPRVICFLVKSGGIESDLPIYLKQARGRIPCAIEGNESRIQLPNLALSVEYLIYLCQGAHYKPAEILIFHVVIGIIFLWTPRKYSMRRG